MTGITVTTLLTSAATAFAQNIFEALFGGPLSSPVRVPDANFTARDRQQLANPPYQQAWISAAYRRQIVHYNRKEAPGSILVDTDRRYLYYVLLKGKAIRYGAIVGEEPRPWSGVATLGRKAEWPGWTPTESEKRRLGPLPNYVEGGARNPMGARALYLYAGGQDTLYRIGSSCETTGFQTESSNHTTISSTIVARPGISSSISLGASCLSDCANGRTSSDQWDSV
jgi:lipoprotein-anchoring transpeptidase ErfK/SrfK